MYPQGSRFIRINTNDKGEAAVLDLLLDGTSDAPIGINGVQVPASTLQITYLSFAANTAFIVVSPKGAKAPAIPASTEDN